jgi:ornithine cyclodeaminase/alanine dehydrogenase
MTKELPASTILLSRGDLEPLLSLESCIQAVEAAFRQHGLGRIARPGLLHADAARGEFHVKAGVMDLGRSFFAIKINGGFFRNRAEFGMPNIQGVVLLCDGEHGYPLAVMDSKAITVMRTGAATAVAASHLARADSQVATICGCGLQGAIQLEALLRCFPLRKVFAHARNAESMERFAAECGRRFGVEVTTAPDLEAALSETDICVTCTPSREPIVRREWIRPGTFIAAVGADSPDKQELDSGLLPGSKVVADVLGQCVEVGEIHHALSAGLMSSREVHAELGQVVAGLRPGRTNDEEVTIFDSTGTAFQDVAAAVMVYRKVEGRTDLARFNFFAER